MPRLVVVSLLALACTPDTAPVNEIGSGAEPTSSATDDPVEDTPGPAEGFATDVGLTSGYQDMPFGNWQRGRTALAADFDDDGWVDVANGNPGDVSYILRNVTEPGGDIRFETGQVLIVDEPFWGGSAADFDNDGDTDLYMAMGGNEGSAFDIFWVNHEGTLIDAPLAGLRQMQPNGNYLPTATGGAIAFDYDNDGWLDVFANGEVANPGLVGSLQPEMVLGLNPIWRNNRDGTFTDVGRQVGLTSQMATRNSTVLDFDEDGDLDLFENNWIGPNILWRNRLAEDGVASFEDVTELMSLGGGDLSFPYVSSSMCTIASDLNQDGWEDLLVFRRWPKEPNEPSVHGNTHLVWLNLEGQGFFEASAYTILADTFVYRDHNGFGVMGCQIGDLDADGLPDLFMGNGGPERGERNNLFVSAGKLPERLEHEEVGSILVPQWEDWSHLIDFPAPHDARHGPNDGDGDVYPYRTHGSIFADFDRDGLYELGVHNGGPSTNGSDAEMQEPNRLFKFELPEDPHWLRLELVGDGETVNRDAIGARVRAVVSEGRDGARRDIYARRRTSTGFAAQNQPDVFLGLGRADTVHQIEVIWPSGKTDQVAIGQVDTRIRVELVPGSDVPLVDIVPVAGFPGPQGRAARDDTGFAPEQ